MESRRRYEEALAQARAELKEIRNQVRAAMAEGEPVERELTAKLSLATDAVELARAELAEFDATERDLEENATELGRQARRGATTGPTERERALNVLGRGVAAAMRGREFSEELLAEWQEYGHPADTDPMATRNELLIPVDLLAAAKVEQRAATGMGSAVSTVTVHNRMAGFVRPMPVAGPVLGVYPEMVGSGEQRYWWVNVSPDAAAAGEDPNLGALDVEAATTFETDLHPTRILAKRGYTLEAGAEYSMLGQIVVDDAMSALDDELEKLVIAGAGASADFEGLYHRAGTAREAPGTADDYNDVIEAFQALVDGKYITDLSGARAITSASVWAHLATLQPGSGVSGPATALDWLKENLGALAVSGHAPAMASNEGKVLVRCGDLPQAVAYPQWQRSVVFDDVTSAGVGRKAFGLAMADFFVPQKAAGAGARDDWRIVEIKTA